MRVLEMLAPHAVTLLGPGELDRPRNALSMVPRFHSRFGALRFVFEPASELMPGASGSGSGSSCVGVAAGSAVSSGGTGVSDVGASDRDDHAYFVVALDPAIAAFMPTSRILLNGHHQTVEAPSLLLLQIHRATAKILRASAAGEYIERLLRERDYGMVKADGSTSLGALVAMGLSCKQALVRS